MQGAAARTTARDHDGQSASDDGSVAGRALSDADRLLPGEGAGAASSAQVIHWVRVYGELLAVKDTVLPELAQMAASASPSAQEEIGLDLALLRKERDRLQRRFDHWRAEAEAAGLDLSDLEPAGATRAGSPEQFSSIAIGPVRFDVHAHDVRVAGRLRRLTPNEWRLLNYLVSRRGEVVSRSEIALGAWGPAYVNRPGEVELYISRLRRKLAPASGRGAPLIETVRGRGYRLVPD